MFFFVKFVCWIVSCSNDAQKNGTTIVETTLGKVQGFVELNGSIDVFFGIPFAKPPIGQLRFEKPEAPAKWDGVLQAQVHKNSCYPHATPDWLNDFLQQGASSEDCLYLNIFTPHESCKFVSLLKPLLPVLLIIHGGGFVGSSRQFSNYTDIGNNFVKKGIVVVSIQYRLGELGSSLWFIVEIKYCFNYFFLIINFNIIRRKILKFNFYSKIASTGDDMLPGNNGLWDQLAALKFVRKNIAKFGGDPKQITVFGQSAGSASSSALGLSPHSRDLFKQSIQMSGSAMVSWVYGSRVVKETTMLAEVVGCSLANSTAIKSCLKATSADALLQAVVEMGPARREPNCLIFGPRIDGDFFPEDIPALINEAPSKPTLQGFTRLESLIFTFLTGLNSTLSHQMLPWSGTFGAADLLDYINAEVAYEERFGNSKESVGQRIFDFYSNSTNGQSQNSSAFYIRQYTELIGDLMFVMPIIQEIQQKVAKKWPMYIYESTYANEAAFPPTVPIHESFHTNDFNYLFDNPFSSFTFDEQDLKIQAFMLEAFRNFIKKGNPSTSELNWPKVASVNQLKYVDIKAPEPAVVANMVEVLRRANFWKKLTAQFPEYNLVREIPNAAAADDGDE